MDVSLTAPTTLAGSNTNHCSSVLLSQNMMQLMQGSNCEISNVHGTITLDHPPTTNPTSPSRSFRRAECRNRVNDSTRQLHHEPSAHHKQIRNLETRGAQIIGSGAQIIGQRILFELKQAFGNGFHMRVNPYAVRSEEGEYRAKLRLSLKQYTTQIRASDGSSCF